MTDSWPCPVGHGQRTIFREETKMGMDIYQKVYCHTKQDKRFMPACCFMDDVSMKDFPIVVYERFYPLFCLFGGKMTSFPKLECVKFVADNHSDWFKNTPLADHIEDIDAFAIAHTNVSELKKELPKYRNALTSLDKWKAFRGGDEFVDVEDYEEYAEKLIGMIDDLLDKLEKLTSFIANHCYYIDEDSITLVTWLVP